MSDFYPTIADVSKWQGDIDWDNAKSYLHFVIIRAQDGMSTPDSKLVRNVAACERLGIPYYIYGFYRGGGAAEARKMVERAQAAGAKSVLGYVCDLETSGYSRAGVAQYIAALPQGLKNGLYIAHNLYGEYGAGYGQSWTWIPRYGSNNGHPQTCPAYPCDLWQFTSTGNVPGIPGNVDLNACMNKDLAYFVGEEQELNANQAAQLQEIYHQVTRTDDCTGRGMENNDHDHIKWIAKVVQDNADAIEALAKSVEQLSEKLDNAINVEE